MRVIIAGSGTLGPHALNAVMELHPDLVHVVTVVICGCAVGIDTAGFHWARKHNISVEFHPAWLGQAQWAESVARSDEIIMPHLGWRGRSAGVFRNMQMLQSPAESVLTVWDGKSPGTRNMITLANRNNVPLIAEQIERQA